MTKVAGVNENREVEAGLHGIIKSMVALAASDRIIDDRELRVIGSIFNYLTSKYLDPFEVKRASETFRDENISLGDMLEGIEPQIEPAFKKTIVKACYMVSMADEILDQVELDDVKNVGKYLKLDPKTVDDLIIEMEKTIQEEQPYH